MGGLRQRAVAVAGAVLVLAGLAAGTAAAGTHRAAGRAASGGTWGTAEEVPGLAALNTGRNAQVLAVSCAAANHCSAGGYYSVGSFRHSQVFVVSKT